MHIGRVIIFTAAIGALGSALPMTAIGADAGQGKEIFQSRCAMCHSTEAGVNKFGPSLADVVGRRAGTVPNFNYSQALKSSDVVWNRKTLDEWLKNPHAFIHGDRMPFAGLSSESQRADVIAYLESISGK